jgi:prephenate dehydrogenase
MAELSTASFRSIAILGTGLMGGSFGLALRRYIPDAHIVGYDREPAIEQARARGAIDEAAKDVAGAVRGADLIYIALPISAAIEMLAEIARHAAAGALVTDTCSTKRAVCRAAGQHFRGGAKFLGGHPMAGKETEGIAGADADLFRGANYALIADEFAQKDPRVAAFAKLLEKMDARIIWLDAETHDWAAAIISHLPQMAAIALAEVIAAETDESGLPVTLAGKGARDSLRLAGSPYAMWRDIAITNSDNLSRALDRLCQAIDQIRTHLTSRELEESFAEANRIHKSLES